MLSITSLVAPSFQKICANCHVANVIISPMGDVHCNICHSKSIVQKYVFFVASLQPMMNLCYWLLNANGLKQLCIWQNLNSWICFLQNMFNSLFQFTFKVNFDCLPHLLSWPRIFWDTLCHGLRYFGILWAMSCPRIFLDTFGNIMA